MVGIYVIEAPKATLLPIHGERIYTLFQAHLIHGYFSLSNLQRLHKAIVIKKREDILLMGNIDEEAHHLQKSCFGNNPCGYPP